MARKYSSESSGRDESESSDYERRNRGKRDRESDRRSGKRNERRDEHVDDDGDDKDRERVNERDVRDRDGRSGQRSERVDRKESSEEEDGELVERDVERREGERSRRYDEDDRRERREVVDLMKMIGEKGRGPVGMRVSIDGGRVRMVVEEGIDVSSMVQRRMVMRGKGVENQSDEMIGLMIISIGGIEGRMVIEMISIGEIRRR
ncbi:hypothetical protein CFP56_010424 [Quercus suber]|uniref:Uncharacterized protein n=1 Tax=Quercus suber TaxID=58331 RepID=A0AAW0M521_QUESU